MPRPTEPAWARGRRGTLVAWCGPATIVVSAVGILSATLLAPSFSWAGNALSDLGAAGASTAPLFNGTLILAGLLGLPFAFRLVVARSGWVRWLGALLFGASSLLLALIGVFPLPSPYHAAVAVPFFLLFTIALALDGVGAIRGGRGIDGALSFSLAGIHVVGWLVWSQSGLAGVAIPEMIGSVALWIWILRRFREVRASG